MVRKWKAFVIFLFMLVVTRIGLDALVPRSSPFRANVTFSEGLGIIAFSFCVTILQLFLINCLEKKMRKAGTSK